MYLEQRRMCPPNAERGTTLIEALIAMVVLSIGLLGMAGLQANALKLNQTSMQRSQATLLAYSILDELRADSAAAKNGGYDLAISTPTPNCNPRPTTALDIWRCEIERSLGTGASGEVCRVAASNSAACTNAAGDEFFRISLQWTEAEITDSSGTNVTAGNAAMVGAGTLTVVGRL